jgi:hypothetical protein
LLNYQEGRFLQKIEVVQNGYRCRDTPFDDRRSTSMHTKNIGLEDGQILFCTDAAGTPRMDLAAAQYPI